MPDMLDPQETLDGIRERTHPLAKETCTPENVQQIHGFYYYIAPDQETTQRTQLGIRQAWIKEFHLGYPTNIGDYVTIVDGYIATVKI